MRLSIWAGVKLVLRKEFTTGWRFRAAWTVMLMFALTTLACVSLAMQGSGLEPRLAAALFWVIIFFSSLAGADRVFADEASSGTLLALRIYGSAQAVLFGKMLYTLCILLLLGIIIAPLYLIFMNITVVLPFVFILTLLLGIAGVAAAGTLIAALTTGASVHGGLFSILILPVILPVFLPAIFLTTGAFGGAMVKLSYLGGMALYDLVLTVGASVLFDYLWFEE